MANGRITVDGVEYVRADSQPTGKRAIIVVDRGWVYAGDVHEENGRIRLTKCVWVFNWREIAFNGLVANPGDERADVRPFPNGVDLPADAEIYRVPVHDSWGLE